MLLHLRITCEPRW